MAINILAPGVYSSIRDLSAFVDNQPSTTGFIAMICESGPDNELIRVTNNTFNSVFGVPNLNYTHSSTFGMGPYVASSFLEESNNLYVIRCLPTTATYSNLYITTSSLLLDSTNGIPVDSSGATSNQSITCSYKTVASLNTKADVTGELSTGIDDTSASGYTLVAFTGLGRGEYYNNILIDINQHPNTGLAGVRQDLYIVDIYKLQKYTTRLTSADATSGGNAYDDYSLAETFEISFDPDAKDQSTESIFIEDIINTYSNLVRVYTNRVILKEMVRRNTAFADSTAVNGHLTINFAEGFVQSHTTAAGNFDISYGIQMASGSSGAMFTQYGLDGTGAGASYAGNLLAKAYQGTLESATDGTGRLIDEVLDVENFRFDVVLDAGYPINVKTQIGNLAIIRKDCLAVLDNGDHKTATAALATRQSSDSTSTLAFNSAFISLYEPYSKVYDLFTGSDIWVPPSYHVSRIIGFNDNSTEVWYPLAGFNRATVNTIKELRYNPSLGDRESFIKYQLNPIVRFGIGYSLFSQRTTLRQTSALQEIHIARLQMFIDRALKDFCRNYIFELNDEQTRSEIRKEINIFLSEIKSKRGLDSYTISTPVDEYDIKRRRISVNISLTPVRSVEQIYLTYSLN